MPAKATARLHVFSPKVYAIEPNIEVILLFTDEQKQKLAKALEETTQAAVVTDLKPKKVDGKATFLEALDAAMGGEVRWTFDPREFEVIGDRKVAPPSEGSGLDVLEDLCAQKAQPRALGCNDLSRCMDKIA